MQTPQFTFSDLPLEKDQKEGEIDYSKAKVRHFVFSLLLFLLSFLF
jgi:hypothetical protein